MSGLRAVWLRACLYSLIVGGAWLIAIPATILFLTSGSAVPEPRSWKWIVLGSVLLLVGASGATWAARRTREAPEGHAVSFGPRQQTGPYWSVSVRSQLELWQQNRTRRLFSTWILVRWPTTSALPRIAPDNALPVAVFGIALLVWSYRWLRKVGNRQMEEFAAGYTTSSGQFGTVFINLAPRSKQLYGAHGMVAWDDSMVWQLDSKGRVHRPLSGPTKCGRAFTHPLTVLASWSCGPVRSGARRIETTLSVTDENALPDGSNAALLEHITGVCNKARSR